MHHQQLKRDNYVLIKYDGGGKPHGVLQRNNLCALIDIPTRSEFGLGRVGFIVTRNLTRY